MLRAASQPHRKTHSPKICLHSVHQSSHESSCKLSEHKLKKYMYIYNRKVIALQDFEPWLNMLEVMVVMLVLRIKSPDALIL